MEILISVVFVMVLFVGGIISLLFRAGKKVVIYSAILVALASLIFGLIYLVDHKLANEIKDKMAEKIRKKKFS